jgi:hypothetical protein
MHGDHLQSSTELDHAMSRASDMSDVSETAEPLYKGANTNCRDTDYLLNSNKISLAISTGCQPTSLSHNAEMRKCRSAEVQKCRSAKVQESNRTLVQQSKSALPLGRPLSPRIHIHSG